MTILAGRTHRAQRENEELTCLPGTGRTVKWFQAGLEYRYDNPNNWPRPIMMKLEVIGMTKSVDVLTRPLAA